MTNYPIFPYPTTEEENLVGIPVEIQAQLFRILLSGESVVVGNNTYRLTKTSHQIIESQSDDSIPSTSTYGIDSKYYSFSSHT